MRKLKPGDTVVGARPPAFIIAEMACSHEGDPLLACKIIDGAGQAGADAIQFQVFRLEDLLVPHHKDYGRVKQLELPQKEWSELAGYVRDRYPAMQIVACVSERSSVDFSERVALDAYKIHSADLSNPYLIKYVASTHKRVDLSIGASTIDEVQTAIDWIRGTSDSPIWLMYGYQNFPTPTHEIHLRYMMKLHELFELPIGYQDHSDAETEAAFWLPAAAAGMGVNVLEKHITHDRSLKGTDHEAALNPDEFARFVQMIRTIEQSLGVSSPRAFSAEEIRYRRYAKKSLIASRALGAGEVMSEAVLTFMRADDIGLPPDQASRLVGRRLKHPVARYHLIREEDVT